MADEVRLIDAELLTTNIAQIAKNCARSDAQKALSGRILFMIENMPTSEAEPVKHGRWMYPFYCSVCGFAPYYSSDLTYNYCPNCGTRMDGDSK